MNADRKNKWLSPRKAIVALAAGAMLAVAERRPPASSRSG